MNRKTFSAYLEDAAACARDFARENILEPLPDDLVFRVRLNSSCDGNPLHKDEVVFPEDSHDVAKAMFLQRASAEEAVNALYREGRVPEWVNVSVIGETGEATLIELLACGRYTDNDELLYHHHERRPPFHILGPPLPIDHQDGKRFSIYNRAECWSQDDLAQVVKSADKVWSLALLGPDFNDSSLERLPALPRLSILELKDTRVAGHGIASVKRHKKLRVFRVEAQGRDLDLQGLPALNSLDCLGLHQLGPGSTGLQLKRLGPLEALTLEFQGKMPERVEFPDVTQHLSLRADSLSHCALPVSLDSLSLTFSQGDEALLRRVLSGVCVRAAHLRGTPISEGLAEELPGRLGLDYIDLVDTGVSENCVRRIQASHPQLRVVPRLDLEDVSLSVIVLRTRACFNTTLEARDRSADGLPRGEEIAERIAKALRARGMGVGEVDADSWSWFFPVVVGASQAQVHVAWQKGADFKHISQDWVVLVEAPAKPGFIARLFGARQETVTTAAMTFLVRPLHEMLQAACFADVRWFREDEWHPDSQATGADAPITSERRRDVRE